MKHIIYLVLFLVYTVQLNAQEPTREWGEVPMKELEMTTYELDPDAGAVMLNDHVDISFIIEDGFYTIKYEYYKRIKILNESEFKQADVKIKFYNDDRIRDLKAQSITLTNGKEIRRSVRQDDFFEIEENQYYNSSNFAIPGVKEGSVIEYQYTIFSKNIVFLNSWYFQVDIPIIWCELNAIIPEEFTYVAIKNGNLPFHIKSHSSFEQDYGTLGGTQFRYVVKDAPAMVEEDFVTTMKDYYTKIEFQLRKADKNGYEETFFSTWKELSTKLRLWDGFGAQLKSKLKHKKLTDLVPNAIINAKNEKEKAQKVYHLVNKSIKWNKIYNYWTNESINKAYNKALGNSAAINLGLITCLREAGLKADPVILSTRKHGKPFKEYPFLRQFNHVIAVVELDGKSVFMDATNPEQPYDLLDFNNLNQTGYKWKDKEEGEWVEIKPQLAAISSNITMEIKDDELIGKVINSYRGYEAVRTRQKYQKEGEQNYLNNCLGTEGDYTVESAEFKGHVQPDLRFIESLQVTFEDVSAIDQLYINPISMAMVDENPFKLKDRMYPVDVGYPFVYSSTFKFIIPEGYEIVEMPESLKIKIPDGTATYHYVIERKENTINVLSRLNQSKAIYSPYEYHGLKVLYEKMIEKQEEQIVLKKN